jgi:hypothetical protein
MGQIPSTKFLEWKNVSHSAKELIKGMLSVDPTKRLTIEQVMKNTWIAVSFFLRHCIGWIMLDRFGFNHVSFTLFSNTLKFPRLHFTLKPCSKKERKFGKEIFNRHATEIHFHSNSQA